LWRRFSDREPFWAPRFSPSFISAGGELVPVGSAGVINMKNPRAAGAYDLKDMVLHQIFRKTLSEK
jgi:hypothetical protein